MFHLFSFVGNSDLAAAGLGRPDPGDGPGPVARTLASGLAPWSALTVVDDRSDACLIEAYVAWLRARCPKTPVRIWRQPLANPAAFEEVLAAARAAVHAAGLSAMEARAFLTTPGTSAMGMVWLYLALQPDSRARLLTAHTAQRCRWIELPASGVGSGLG